MEFEKSFEDFWDWLFDNRAKVTKTEAIDEISKVIMRNIYSDVIINSYVQKEINIMNISLLKKIWTETLVNWIADGETVSRENFIALRDNFQQKDITFSGETLSTEVGSTVGAYILILTADDMYQIMNYPGFFNSFSDPEIIDENGYFIRKTHNGAFVIGCEKFGKIKLFKAYKNIHGYFYRRDDYYESPTEIIEYMLNDPEICGSN